MPEGRFGIWSADPDLRLVVVIMLDGDDDNIVLVFGVPVFEVFVKWLIPML